MSDKKEQTRINGDYKKNYLFMILGITAGIIISAILVYIFIMPNHWIKSTDKQIGDTKYRVFVTISSANSYGFQELCIDEDFDYREVSNNNYEIKCYEEDQDGYKTGSYTIFTVDRSRIVFSEEYNKTR